MRNQTSRLLHPDSHISTHSFGVQLRIKGQRCELGAERSAVQFPGPAGQMWLGLEKEKRAFPSSTFTAAVPFSKTLNPPTAPVCVCMFTTYGRVRENNSSCGINPVFRYSNQINIKESHKKEQFTDFDFKLIMLNEEK